MYLKKIAEWKSMDEKYYESTNETKKLLLCAEEYSKQKTTTK